MMIPRLRFHFFTCFFALAGAALAQSYRSQAQGASRVDSAGMDVAELNRRAVEQSTTAPELAMQLARWAQANAERTNNISEQARALNTIGVVLRYKDVYDSALWYHGKALTLFEAIHEPRGKAETLLNIGGVYQSRADFATALEYHLQALPLYESLNDTAGIARALASVGIVHTARGAFEQARAAHRKSLKLRAAIGNDRALAHAWRNLGSVYLAEGKTHPPYTDTALAMYKSALAVFERAGDTQGISLSYTSIGAALQQMGRTKEALDYEFKAIPLLEQLGDRRGLAVLFNTIAASFNALGNHGRALLYADRALAIGDSIGAGAERRDALKVRSDALAGLGNHVAALEAYRQHSTLKDSLFTLKSAQQVAMLQTRYELAQKEKEVMSLEQQRNLEALKVRGLWGALAVATLFFSVVVVLVNNRYRLKKQAADVLAAQNAEISRQRELLQTQAEEISHANTSLHEVNAQLALQNATLTDLDNEKNEFLGIAAHDLKNPLSNILLTVQLVESYMDDTPKERVLEWTRSITTGAEYMLNIITNLLDVNKVESGKIEMHIEPIEASVVALVAESYAHRAAEKNIALVVEVPSQPLCFMADRNALQQVVDNLISNAVKYSPHGKNVFVEVKEQGTGNKEQGTGNKEQGTGNKEQDGRSVPCCSILVRDEGPGISAEDQTKLFGKFARLSAQPTGGEHSTGLGLSIVKKLVEAMNGRVWCESELGKGATFIVELPRT
jgi:signal transduction histidine kinase